MFFTKIIVIINLVISEIFCGILFRNDKCYINEKEGRCLLIEDCPNAVEGITRGIFPQNCGFENQKPIVCCLNQNEYQWNLNAGYAVQNSGPLEYEVWSLRGQWNRSETMRQRNEGKVQNTDRINQKRGIRKRSHIDMCKEFINEINSQKTDDGGNSRRRRFVVGGRDAFEGEYPHMALLGYGGKTKIEWNCGGSLISKTFILTAAHCITHSTLGEVKHVRLGDIRFDGTSGTAQDFQIIRKIRHPEFKSPLVYNDIALLELNKPATFTSDVKPACLHSGKDINDILFISATGWGLTEFGGKRSEILQTVNLGIFAHEECNNTYKNIKRRAPYGILDDRQICAGGRGRELDTCQGDSGGPLQWQEGGPEDLYKIIGVTSLGKGCGVIDVPAIYTRVSHYIPWIESIVF